MLRFFIGKAVKCDKDHTVTFSISDFADVGDSLTATPFCKLSRLPLRGDELLIIQPDSRLEIFFYTIMPEDEDISMKFGKAKIIISATSQPDAKGEKGEYEIDIDTDTDSKIKLSKDSIELATKKIKASMSGTNAKITVDNSTSIVMSKSKVTINNHLEVLK